jgi:hypothetical protein
MMPPPDQCSRSSQQGIVPSLAGVNHDGLPCPARQLQLLDEHVALHVARREIVMVIEADLAHGQHFGFGGQRFSMAANVSGVAFAASCGCTPTVA